MCLDIPGWHSPLHPWLCGTLVVPTAHRLPKRSQVAAFHERPEAAVLGARRRVTLSLLGARRRVQTGADG